MTRQTISGLALFLLGLIGGMAAHSGAQNLPSLAPEKPWSYQPEDLRLELGTGFTKHRLAPPGAWHYEDDGFQSAMKLLVGSYQVGLRWMPIKRGDTLIGIRVGYADLGKIHASNSFPVIEDRSNADARVNPVCDHATLHGCTGRFDGVGQTRGFYIGPAIERDFGGGVVLGIEGGLLGYESYWRAGNIRVVDGTTEFTPPMWGQNFTWDSARGYHVTPYVGANARWHNVYFAGRLYSQVHAADTAKCADCIGMTSGPVWSVMVGYSTDLKWLSL